MKKPPFRSKETSWLSFNARVLQEARDPEVPLLERIRFLGIYSSNLDEFFRVRVATLRRLASLGKYYKQLDIPNPKKTLKEVNALVAEGSKVFNIAYAEVFGELEKEGVRLIDEKSVPKGLQSYLHDYFEEHVLPKMMPTMVKSHVHLAQLKDNPMYLAVRLSKSKGGRPAHAVLEMPTEEIPRFHELPEYRGKKLVMYLDDIIRFGLPRIFRPLPYDQFESYAIKFTRDSELELDDDITTSLLDRLSGGLRTRQAGSPVRLNYDKQIPESFLTLLTGKLHLTGGDSLFPGARYHNRKDLMKFPSCGVEGLTHPSFVPSPHPAIAKLKNGDLFARIRKGDLLLHTPYQPFSTFLDLLRQASLDPRVKSIAISQYRLAKNSCVARALVGAVRAGKYVTVLVEPTARFDEEANIAYANEYQEAGIHVIVGVPGLKVHSKICLIERSESKGIQRYSAIGTGNFNEDTAKLYTDHLLLTANPEFGKDLQRIFRFFENTYRPPKLTHLIASPFGLRDKIEELIENEISNAQLGKPSGISMKLNNLSDPESVALLYKASAAGVPIRLIVRSMFSPVMGEEGFSDNIEAISVVDRFLEHTRILHFENSGSPETFITSADFLPRNFDGRVEVTCPIYSPKLQKQLTTYLDLQWADNKKARVLDAELTNARFVPSGKGKRSQQAIAEYLEGTT